MNSNVKRAGTSVKIKSFTKDLTQGNLLKNIILFTLPIIATGILQLLFNAADIVVVGRFASDTALAAVGSTSSLINLIIGLLMGLSVGAGVGAAKYFGSKDEKGMEELVHTALHIAVIGGLFIGVAGFFCAKYFLIRMETPENVIDQASQYVRLYFIGVPFTVIYNFCAAILRSVGDTKRPLYFLLISGVVNVLFNLMFVLSFGMDVDGVAIATVISQVISCVMAVVYLCGVHGTHRLHIGRIRLVKDKLKEILAVGIPAGVQGSLFSISNVIIQSAINSFGDVAMSGNAAAASIEGFVWVTMNSFHQAGLAFAGQHIGARKAKRLNKIMFACVGCVSAIGLIAGMGAFFIGENLLSIYNTRADVIAFGMKRLSYVCAIYFVCGAMDTFAGLLRGMNRSLLSMLISLICICGLRILWIYTYFAAYPTLDVLYFSYPLSWAAGLAAHIVAYIFAYRKIVKEENEVVSRGKTPTISEG